MFKKIKTWYDNQNETVKAFIWIGIICIIGIIIRWNAVVEGIKKGFEFYS